MQFETIMLTRFLCSCQTYIVDKIQPIDVAKAYHIQVGSESMPHQAKHIESNRGESVVFVCFFCSLLLLPFVNASVQKTRHRTLLAQATHQMQPLQPWKSLTECCCNPTVEPQVRLMSSISGYNHRQRGRDVFCFVRFLDFFWNCDFWDVADFNSSEDSRKFPINFLNV